MRFVNNTKTAMLLAAMIGLCMLVGHFINAGGAGMLIGFLIGGGGAIVSFFFSDKIAVAAMRGQEVTRNDLPWFHDMIERLSQRAELPMPRVYVCPQEAPNAFATGRSPKRAAVAITQGMLRNFPRDEIEGVMAHELAHVKNRDVLISTVAAVMAGAISMMGYMLLFFGGRRDSPIGAVGALLMIFLAPIAAGLIQMAISRSREYVADHYGGELAGDPRKLARALQRLQAGNERIPMESNPAFNQMFIMEPLSARGAAGLFATHPPTEERIRRLEEQAAGR